MAVFTPLSHEEVQELLAHYSLGTLTDLKGIGSGIENTNYFLTTNSGRYILTVFERLRSDELPFYLELMQHLAARGLPVPAPQATRDGSLITSVKGKPAAIVTRLPGQAVLHPGAAQCALVGATLADMHLQAQDFAPFQPNLRGIGWWKDTVPLLQPYVDAETFQMLAEEVIYQDTFFRSAVAEALPTGPIHADLFRDNVLIESVDGTERIGGVIDFYFAGCSLWLFDLAVALNDWCIDLASGAIDMPRAQALLDAYHAKRPLLETEKESWRTVLRAAALRFWISRLYDLHLPRKASLLTPHDPAHFQRVLMDRCEAAQLPWPQIKTV